LPEAELEKMKKKIRGRRDEEGGKKPGGGGKGVSLTGL